MIVDGLLGVVPTQHALRALEDYPFDFANWWFTEPEELLDILRTAPQLSSVGESDWRLVAVPASVSNQRARDIVLAELLLGLEAPKPHPGVITSGPADHWELCSRVWTTGTGAPLVFELLDPLPDPTSAPNSHSHGDQCGGGPPFEGRDYIFNLTATAFKSVANPQSASSTGDFDLKIDATGLNEPTAGSVPLDQFGPGPMPSQVTTTASQFSLREVALVFGPSHTKAVLDAAIARVKSARKKAKALDVQAAEAALQTNFLPLLRSTANEFGVDGLMTAGRDSEELVSVGVRAVRTAFRADRGYVIASAVNRRNRQGVIATFAAAEGTPLLAMKLTCDTRLIESLQRHREAQLVWWPNDVSGRRRLPNTPFFPMAVGGEGVGGTRQLKRLYDDITTEGRIEG